MTPLTEPAVARGVTAPVEAAPAEAAPWSPAQAVLYTQALALFDLAVALAASTVVFWAVEAEKLVRRRVAQRSDRFPARERPGHG